MLESSDELEFKVEQFSVLLRDLAAAGARFNASTDALVEQSRLAEREKRLRYALRVVRWRRLTLQRVGRWPR